MHLFACFSNWEFDKKNRLKTNRHEGGVFSRKSSSDTPLKFQSLSSTKYSTEKLQNMSEFDRQVQIIEKLGEMNPAFLFTHCLFNFDLLLTQELISLYWKTRKIWKAIYLWRKVMQIWREGCISLCQGLVRGANKNIFDPLSLWSISEDVNLGKNCSFFFMLKRTVDI